MTTTKNSSISFSAPIKEQVVSTISRTLKVAPQRLLPYTHFVDDLHLDDIDKMLLIVSLESDLKVYLTPEQVDSIETIGDVTRCFSDN